MFINPGFDSSGGHAQISKLAGACDQIHTIAGVAIGVFDLPPDVIWFNDNLTRCLSELANTAMPTCMMASDQWKEIVTMDSHFALGLWSSMGKDVLKIRGSSEGEHRAFKVQCACCEDIPSFGDDALNPIGMGIECGHAGKDIPGPA